MNFIINRRGNWCGYVSSVVKFKNYQQIIFFKCKQLPNLIFWSDWPDVPLMLVWMLSTTSGRLLPGTSPQKTCCSSEIIIIITKCVLLRFSGIYYSIRCKELLAVLTVFVLVGFFSTCVAETLLPNLSLPKRKWLFTI